MDNPAAQKPVGKKEDSGTRGMGLGIGHRPGAGESWRGVRVGQEEEQ